MSAKKLVDLVDMLSEAGARELGSRIEQYWKAEGYPQVRCTVEPVASGGHNELRYQVRSNLINGRPPR